jgi:hypothetical protein
MDYESEVVKFLTQKENLPFALEIAEKIVVVKEKLQKDFWKSVEAKLKERLDNSSFRETWMIKIDDDVLSSWSGLSIVPTTTPQSLHIFPRIEQWSGDLRLFYGIRYSRKNEEPISMKVLNDFFNELGEENYKNNYWWVGYKLTDIRPMTNNFLFKVVDNLDALVEDVINMVWELFSDKAKSINQINEAIAANNGSP